MCPLLVACHQRTFTKRKMKRKRGDKASAMELLGVLRVELDVCRLRAHAPFVNHKRISTAKEEVHNGSVQIVAMSCYIYLYLPWVPAHVTHVNV